MKPERRIFWMLSSAVLALLFSRSAPLVSVVNAIATWAWIIINCGALKAGENAK